MRRLSMKQLSPQGVTRWTKEEIKAAMEMAIAIKQNKYAVRKHQLWVALLKHKLAKTIKYLEPKITLTDWEKILLEDYKYKQKYKKLYNKEYK